MTVGQTSIPYASLGSLTKIKTGKLDANASSINGAYPFFTCAAAPLSINTFSYDCECILVAGNGDLNVKYYNGKFDAYQRTYIIESKDSNILLPRYLFRFLELHVAVLRVQAIGGVIKYIKLENLTEARIPLAPLENQRKIAAILDKAQELIDLRKAQLEKMDEFLRSVFLDMFGDPVKNPKGWEKCELQKVVTRIESGWSPVCLDRTAEFDEWGVLKLSAVTYGNFDANKNKALPENLKPMERNEVKHNDLLFSRKNTYDLVGASAYVFASRPKLMLSDLIFRLVTTKDIHKIFLWKLFCDSKFRPNIRRLASGSAGSMPNISKESMLTLQVPLPPLSLQTQFAAIVEATEAQKALMQQSLTEMENNFNSLMQRAFRGELF